MEENLADTCKRKYICRNLKKIILEFLDNRMILRIIQKSNFYQQLFKVDSMTYKIFCSLIVIPENKFDWKFEKKINDIESVTNDHVFFLQYRSYLINKRKFKIEVINKNMIILVSKLAENNYDIDLRIGKIFEEDEKFLLNNFLENNPNCLSSINYRGLDYQFIDKIMNLNKSSLKKLNFTLELMESMDKGNEFLNVEKVKIYLNYFNRDNTEQNLDCFCVNLKKFTNLRKIIFIFNIENDYFNYLEYLKKLDECFFSNFTKLNYLKYKIFVDSDDNPFKITKSNNKNIFLLLSNSFLNKLHLHFNHESSPLEFFKMKSLKRKSLNLRELRMTQCDNTDDEFINLLYNFILRNKNIESFFLTEKWSININNYVIRMSDIFYMIPEIEFSILEKIIVELFKRRKQKIFCSENNFMMELFDFYDFHRVLNENNLSEYFYSLDKIRLCYEGYSSDMLERITDYVENNFTNFNNLKKIKVLEIKILHFNTSLIIRFPNFNYFTGLEKLKIESSSEFLFKFTKITSIKIIEFRDDKPESFLKNLKVCNNIFPLLEELKWEDLEEVGKIIKLISSLKELIAVFSNLKIFEFYCLRSNYEEIKFLKNEMFINFKIVLKINSVESIDDLC